MSESAETVGHSVDIPLRAAGFAPLERWLIGLFFLGLIAPVTLLLSLQHLERAAPYQIVIGFLGLVVPVSLAVWFVGRYRHSLPGVLVAVGSFGMLIAAYVATHLPGASPLHAATILLIHALALTPSYIAIWARARQPMSRPQTLKLPIAEAGATAIMQYAALCIFAVSKSPLYSQKMMAALFALVSLPPLLSAVRDARVERLLPVRFNEHPPYGHISSLGAVTLILFVGVIAALGLWSAAHGVDATISHSTGLATVFGLAVTFGGVAVAPTSRRISKTIEGVTHAVERRLGWVSKAFSWLDAALVFAIAPVVGATQPERIPRYGLLFGHLALFALLGWFMPAPFGLLPLFWAFTAVTAIARRWAWVEEDRENAMLNRKFRGDHIRIGFSNDLRDEALLGFMSLFVIVPLVLRQLHMADHADMFVISSETNANDFWAWVSFFGSELAKAVPFVDWAEIYHVEGASPISMRNEVGDAQHAVFATRVVVDLIFLAALLQAISSLQRSQKLRDMFYNERTLPCLEPFAETSAFRDLAERGDDGWRLIEKVPDPFWSYDEDRLEELALRGEDDPVGFVAGAILKRIAERAPEEALRDEARLTDADLKKLDELLERIREEQGAPQIQPLRQAQLYLNLSKRAGGSRVQIAEIIAENIAHPEAQQALCDFVVGGKARDEWAQVRKIALRGLEEAAAAHGSAEARQVLRWAAENDGAITVARLANAILDRHPDWRSESPPG